MKRSHPTESTTKLKKPKLEDQQQQEQTTLTQLDENLLYEVFKHVDAKTLAKSACVNKQWLKTTQDERLWELICTKQGSTIGCGVLQLRSVVTALGGFRRLFNLYIWPLIKPTSSPAAAAAPPAPMIESSPYEWAPVRCNSSSGGGNSSSSSNVIPTSTRVSLSRWGKDEVNLSLSLLSIRYFEKMNNFGNKGSK